MCTCVYAHVLSFDYGGCIVWDVLEVNPRLWAIVSRAMIRPCVDHAFFCPVPTGQDVAKNNSSEVSDLINFLVN